MWVMKKLTVRLADHEYQDLSRLAQRKERSLNDLVREAVRLYAREGNNGLKPVESRFIPSINPRGSHAPTMS